MRAHGCRAPVPDWYIERAFLGQGELATGLRHDGDWVALHFEAIDVEGDGVQRLAGRIDQVSGRHVLGSAAAANERPALSGREIQRLDRGRRARWPRLPACSCASE